MAQPDLIYKITILELLNKSQEPLSNFRVSDFFLQTNLTEYFAVQMAIRDVQLAGYIESHSTRRHTTYTLTTEGKAALEMFKEKVTEGIEKDITDYLKKNNVAIKDENSHIANVFPSEKGGYLVNLKIADDKMTSLDITMFAGSEENAKLICDNWQSKSDEVYASLMDILIS
ncbi:MAG: DUF4364 family protein [Pseudobutyrivibrio sp.]|nr:DUF4364 family protein [Pseudobutyrivibrio sp.]